MEGLFCFLKWKSLAVQKKMVFQGGIMGCTGSVPSKRGGMGYSGEAPRSIILYFFDDMLKLAYGHFFITVLGLIGIDAHGIKGNILSIGGGQVGRNSPKDAP